jgi:hypothetical protein
MKYIFTILIAILFISCQDESKTTEAPNVTPPDFKWMVGNWIRSNDKEDNTTYEYWSQSSPGEYIGLGCTIQQGDTVFKENLRIAKVEGKWNLIVSGVNETPTLFLVTSQTKNGFISENETNEFPKKIEYVLDGDILKANISAGETAIPFSFKRISNQ